MSVGATASGGAFAGEGGGAKVANYEYQRKCPNAQNLIAIIGDSDDPDRTCTTVRFTAGAPLSTDSGAPTAGPAS